MQVIFEERPAEGAAVVERDEALLLRGAPAVRVGTFGGACVSVGVAQRDREELRDRVLARGLGWVQRSSGGAPLLHLPGDVFWSVVLPADDPRAREGFVHRYGELGAGWSELLSRLGPPTGWEPPPGAHEGYCLTSCRGRVLACGGRALGGASQHRTRQGLLHHGVVASHLDPALLEALFGLSPDLVRERLTSLQDQGLPSGPALAPAAARALASALHRPASSAPALSLRGPP